MQSHHCDLMSWICSIMELLREKDINQLASYKLFVNAQAQ